MNITSEDGNPRLTNSLWDTEALTVFACVSGALLGQLAMRHMPAKAVRKWVVGLAHARAAAVSRLAATLRSPNNQPKHCCLFIPPSPLQAYDDCAIGGSSDATVAKVSDAVSAGMWGVARRPSCQVRAFFCLLKPGATLPWHSGTQSQPNLTSLTVRPLPTGERRGQLHGLVLAGQRQRGHHAGALLIWFQQPAYDPAVGRCVLLVVPRAAGSAR